MKLPEKRKTGTEPNFSALSLASPVDAESMKFWSLQQQHLPLLASKPSFRTSELDSWGGAVAGGALPEHTGL